MKNLTKENIDAQYPGPELDKILFENLPLPQKVLKSMEIPNFSTTNDGAITLTRWIAEEDTSLFWEVMWNSKKKNYFSRFSLRQGEFFGEAYGDTFPEAISKASLKMCVPYTQYTYECDECWNDETIRIYQGEENKSSEIEKCRNCFSEKPVLKKKKLYVFQKRKEING